MKVAKAPTAIGHGPADFFSVHQCINDTGTLIRRTNASPN